MVTRDEIKKMIANYTDVALEEIRDDSELTTDLGLTSFGLVSLIGEFEILLGKSIDNAALKQIRTVEDVYTYIENACGLSK